MDNSLLNYKYKKYSVKEVNTKNPDGKNIVPICPPVIIKYRLKPKRKGRKDKNE